MIVTDENKKYYLQAMKVDFLTERWEREWYTLALMRAAAWGKKIENQDKESKRSRKLINRYNS